MPAFSFAEIMRLEFHGTELAAAGLSVPIIGLTIAKIKHFSAGPVQSTFLRERLSGVENAYMAYLHGRLEMFEDVIYKDIRSITEFSSEDIIFPYMLIPSGIKPLISPRQIGEYQKAMELVRHAKKVFIIGYGINSDDEHITNLLRWKLSECEGEVYYFIYRDFKQTSTSIKKLFKNTNRLKFFHTTDFQGIIDDLISASKTKSR